MNYKKQNYSSLRLHLRRLLDAIVVFKCQLTLNFASFNSKSSHRVGRFSRCTEWAPRKSTITLPIRYISHFITSQFSLAWFHSSSGRSPTTCKFKRVKSRPADYRCDAIQKRIRTGLNFPRLTISKSSNQLLAFSVLLFFETYFLVLKFNPSIAHFFGGSRFYKRVKTFHPQKTAQPLNQILKLKNKVYTMNDHSGAALCTAPALRLG